jgi:HEAT repeat protein
MPTSDAAWLAAAREDPDPNVRRHALETWAKQPGESLDPVTYALVDPDETVRARAQALLEEALARR